MSHVSPGPGLSEPPAESGDLRTFVLRLTWLLNRVASDLVVARGLDNRYRGALKDMIEQHRINERAQEILTAFDSPTTVSNALNAHGLEPGSAELMLKLAAFDAALQRSGYVLTRAAGPQDDEAPSELLEFTFVADPPPTTESRLHRLLSGVASAFKVANSILKSMAHAIPAAGAYGEIKDSIEQGIDTAANSAGLFGKVWNKVRKPKASEDN